MNANELGYYLWKRINQDQESFRKTRPMNQRGLYFNQVDLNGYIKDYFNFLENRSRNNSAKRS